MNQPAESRERSDSSDDSKVGLQATTKKHECVFITRICVTDIVSSLRRMPANSYLTIEMDGRTTETLSKPASVCKDVMEWDQEILLSSEPSSIISFRIYTSFELGPRLGNGELLRQFKITLGDMLDRDGNHQPIKFLTQKDDIFPSCSSVTITTKRQLCALSNLATKLDSPESSGTSEVERLTDMGHHSLLRYRQLQDETDLNNAIACFERARDMCPPGYPNRSAVLFNLANAKFIYCQVNHRFLDLDIPIALYWDALLLRTSGHPDHATTALELSFALLARFRRRGHEIDRVEAKRLLSTAFELFPAESYGYRAVCFALQMAEITVSTVIPEMEAEMSDEDSIDPDDEQFIQEARLILMHLPIWDPRRPAVLATLGNSLYRRFERSGNLTDIHEAIWMLQDAVKSATDEHPDKPAALSVLGSSFCRRFEHIGDLADINSAISIFEHAISLTPNHHPEKSNWLNNLGASLSCRFEHLGDLADIEKSILVSEEAVHLTPDDHPRKPALLMTLSSSLCRRFGCLGNVTDIDRSISIAEEAVRITPDNNPEKPAWLINLGISLSRRFQHLGGVADVDKSILIFEEAVCLVPDGHHRKKDVLTSLGNALTIRFGRFGDLTDVDRAISTQELAVYLTPNSHPGKPSQLSNLGNSLMSRFEHLEDLADINRSILMFEEAVRLIPGDHPSKSMVLTNLGNATLRRFERLGNLADIDKSVLVKEEATHLTPDGHLSKPSLLNNLGLSLLRRFDKLSDLLDIDRSILMFEKAVFLTCDGDPQKPVRLNNLGSSLVRRVDILGELPDINKSILIFKEVVHLTPNDHPARLAQLYNLGMTFGMRFRQSADPFDLSNAALHFSAATRASTGPTSKRFLAARNWIDSATLQDDPQALLDAYGATIDLLPQLAWLGIPLAERLRILLDAAHVARDAAAAALEAGFPEMAVEWLEQGRSIVWSQFLQLRTPVDELRVEYPDLADRFQQVSQELELASSRHDSVSSLSLMNGDFRSTDPSAIFGAASSSRSIEVQVQRQHNLALTREKLLVEIRSLPCFDRFLLPKTIEQLSPSAHAGSGPVVYLNASKRRCDALVVVPDGESVSVIPVSLPGVCYLEVEGLRRLLHLLLTHHGLILSRRDIAAFVSHDEDEDADLTKLQRLFEKLFTEGGRAVKLKPQQIEGFTADDLLRDILEYLWNNVVRPVLDALGFSNPPSSPEGMIRMFWCSTGPFASLPIHAAGLYRTTEPGTKLSDFAITSYIPSLSSLGSTMHGDTDSDVPTFPIRLVAVPQPLTDGLSVLVSVEEEIENLKAQSANSPFVILRESHGTVEDVLEKMKSADWVHFACHGVQDPLDPLSSGLCLADGRRLKLSDIIKSSSHLTTGTSRRGGGGLAFLSACQTAQGDEKLPEESVHLAAGMLLAGYSGVIATLWAIRDADAPRVTRDVYARLFGDVGDGSASGCVVPDRTRAAEALHCAVQRLRESGAPFTSWVPFIHMGR